MSQVSRHVSAPGPLRDEPANADIHFRASPVVRSDGAERAVDVLIAAVDHGH
jgi:hypothetical protein